MMKLTDLEQFELLGHLDALQSKGIRIAVRVCVECGEYLGSETDTPLWGLGRGVCAECAER